MAEIVEVAVFGATEEIRHTVAVPIDGRRRDIVRGEVRRAKQAKVFEEPLAIIFAALSEEGGVVAVDEEIQLAVAVPVDNRELAAAALTGGIFVHPKRLAGADLHE